MDLWGNRLKEEWRKVHNMDLYDMYCLFIIVRVIKSTRMRWEGHVARIVESSSVYRVLMGKPKGKRKTWKTQA